MVWSVTTSISRKTASHLSGEWMGTGLNGMDLGGSRKRAERSKNSSRSAASASPPDSPCFRFGTWSLQGGLHTGFDLKQVLGDLADRRVDIACLQETHCAEGLTKSHRLGELLCLEEPPSTPPSQRYCLVIFISHHKEVTPKSISSELLCSEF